MLSPKHLLNVIIPGAPLLVGMISEFFMYAADTAMVEEVGNRTPGSHRDCFGTVTGSYLSPWLCDIFQETKGISVLPVSQYRLAPDGGYY